MRHLIAVVAVVASACGEDTASLPYPADYASTFTEVRDCRASADHDLHHIRVLASPSAVAPYQMRAAPFPEDAVVLKEEFDFADDTCSGPAIRRTVMTKLPTGSSPETLDWSWVDVGAGKRIVSEDDSRCIGCHTDCGVAPDGHDGTCAIP